MPCAGVDRRRRRAPKGSFFSASTRASPGPGTCHTRGPTHFVCHVFEGPSVNGRRVDRRRRGLEIRSLPRREPLRGHLAMLMTPSVLSATHLRTPAVWGAITSPRVRRLRRRNYTQSRQCARPTGPPKCNQPRRSLLRWQWLVLMLVGVWAQADVMCSRCGREAHQDRVVFGVHEAWLGGQGGRGGCQGQRAVVHACAAAP
jgi:hypothetical protein